MGFTVVTDVANKRLDPYRSLRTKNLTRFSGRFIAESKPLVRRLVASQLEIESILLDEAYRDDAKDWIPDHIDVLVVPSDWIPDLIGFQFHRGYLGCGIRPKSHPISELTVGGSEGNDRWTSVMLVGVQDPENMGSILRTCSALGISDIVLGPQCVDPFARRVLRVSMGNAFKLRFYETERPLDVLQYLKGMGIESIATSLAADSQDLIRFERNGPAVVLLGNEAHGLPEEIQRTADRRLRIAMDLATDSLNVSVAAGIILHNLCRIC